MRHGAALGLLLGAVVWLAGSPAHALTEGRMSLTNLVARADMIVVGTAVDMIGTQRFFGDYERVVTDVSLDDVEVVKGAAADNGLVITQFGGQVGDVVEWYPGLPVMEVDQRYLVFLLSTDLDVEVPLGGQGLFRIEIDPERGVEVVTSANGRPVLEVSDDFVRFGASPQVDGDETSHLAAAMTLEAFLAEIKARLH